METIVFGEWDLILPGCGETPVFPPQPISDQPVVFGGPHRAGRFTQRIAVFVPDLFELKMCGNIYDPGMGTHPPRARRSSMNRSQSADS